MRRTIFGTWVPSDEPESDNEKAMMDILHCAKNVGIETVDTPIDIQLVARLLKAYDDKLGNIERLHITELIDEGFLKSDRYGSDYEEYKKRELARKIGLKMYEKGLINFEEVQDSADMSYYQVQLRAYAEVIKSRRD